MTRIALIQHPCTENPGENIEKALELAEKAIEGGANIICLQELFHTTYFCREIDRRFFSWAVENTGQILKLFQKLAKYGEAVFTVPFFEKKGKGMYYNSMAAIDADGSIVSHYRKMHIPDDPGFYEKYYFTPGDLGFKIADTRYGKLGLLICWDQWFPEAARATALMGADILIYPTAIGTLPEENDTDKESFLNAWQTIQRSHAIANGCFVASINRTGVEGGTRFWGHSFVSDTFGKIIAEAGEKEQILLADCNFDEIEEQRQIWPFFRDRRREAYRILSE